MKLKLTIDLVPRTSWEANLRKRTSQSNWDKIRKKAYADYGHKCGICEATGKINCHEIWEYDDEKYIQKLKGFIALCDLCHHVKHIGMAGILASQGKLDMDKVIEHFCEVNSCDVQAFEEHSDHAFKEWEERSKHDWVLDLGEYTSLVK